MFPVSFNIYHIYESHHGQDNVGRLVIDGVVDAEDYFSGGMHLFRNNLLTESNQPDSGEISLTRIKRCRRSSIVASMQDRPVAASTHPRPQPFHKTLTSFMILLKLDHSPSSATRVHMG